MSDHCQELVATGDKDRYLSCLFAPLAARQHLFALYAFNIEIARIRDAVSEPQIGLVRQQWWLDTIDGIYKGDTPDHPVAQALADAVKAASLPKQPLHNLITAREFDLYDDAMPSLGDLEGYLGETSSALIQMASLILGAAAPEAAGLAGVAHGLAGILRNATEKLPASRHDERFGRDRNNKAALRPCPETPCRSPGHNGPANRAARFPARKPHGTLSQ